jgi:hypothetical protein
MRSLLDISANTDAIVDLADWVEISTFFHDDKTVSQEDLVRALVRAGGTRAEEGARDKASEAFVELSNRADAIGTDATAFPATAYPFEVDGDLLKISVDPFGVQHAGLLYAFLLAVTRASMDSQSRTLSGVDPTVLFEEVCAESLCQFWGGRSPSSDVFVTGTSNRAIAAGAARRFPRLIDLLAGHLHEGGGWKKGARSPGAGDGGLDLVVWRRFHDRRPGGLVGFAQCKTGEHWRNHLGRHNPRSVCQRFFSTRLILPPLPIYMVPCRVSLDEWVDVMEQHSGILFDRCRIAHFGTHLPTGSIDNCSAWLKATIDRELNELIKKGLRSAPPGPPAPAGATP